MNDMDDMDRIQGTEKDVKSRTRILWGCACSYLLPLIFLMVFIIVRLYLIIRYHY